MYPLYLTRLFRLDGGLNRSARVWVGAAEVVIKLQHQARLDLAARAFTPCVAASAMRFPASMHCAAIALL
jgi:hypothetical protein